MTMEAKIRPWLLWTFIGVILIGGGFTYWYISGGKSGTTPTTTSPTPTKSAVVSPSAKTTATPTSGKTATPSATATPTNGQTSTPQPTSTPAPPAGWKYDIQSLRGKGTYTNGQFTMLIKNDWQFKSDNVAYNMGLYGSSNATNCSFSDWNFPDCTVIISFNPSGTSSETDTFNSTSGGFFKLTFGSSLSEADKNIIRNSFKVL